MQYGRSCGDKEVLRTDIKAKNVLKGKKSEYENSLKTFEDSDFNCQAKTNLTSSICPGFIPAWSVYTCMVSVGTLCTDCKMFGWKLSWTIKYSSFCQWIRQCSHETYTSPHCDIDLEDTKQFFCLFLFSFCMMLKFMTVHHQLGQKKASGSEDTEQYPDTWRGRTVILITHSPPTYPIPHYYNFTTGA